MTDPQHVHDETVGRDSGTHAHNRWNSELQTRNWRLTRTTGTNTRFCLYDRRTGAEYSFDFPRIGLSMGRGDVVKFMVGDAAAIDYDAQYPHRTADLTEAASVYQHDLDSTMLDYLRTIEQTGELPSPDTVIGPEKAPAVDATGGGQTGEDGDNEA